MIFLIFLFSCLMFRSLAGEKAEVDTFKLLLFLIFIEHFLDDFQFPITLIWAKKITATRERVTDELTPVSVEHSATLYNDEAKNGAGRAIDLDLETYPITVPGPDGTMWLQITLDKVHCVRQAMMYKISVNPDLTWTCTETDCSNCVGSSSCSYYILTVSTEGAVSDLSPVSDCKHGDTVKLHLQSVYDDQIYVYEIAIVGNPGKLCIQK